MTMLKISKQMLVIENCTVTIHIDPTEKTKNLGQMFWNGLFICKADEYTVGHYNPIVGIALAQPHEGDINGDVPRSKEELAKTIQTCYELLEPCLLKDFLGNWFGYGGNAEHLNGSFSYQDVIGIIEMCNQTTIKHGLPSDPEPLIREYLNEKFGLIASNSPMQDVQVVGHAEDDGPNYSQDFSEKPSEDK